MEQVINIRHISFERLHNFRDVGGYVGDGGRTVRWRRLYRSDNLGKLRDADEPTFQALGVRTVIDLRYPWEIERAGRVPAYDGLTYHNLSIEHQTYDQDSLGADIDPGPFLAQKFAEVAVDGAAEIREALEIIASGESAPVVFHCAAGKDRTGQLAATVLGLLGAGADDIVADFALTSLATDRLIAGFTERVGRPPRWPGYAQAPPEVMERFLAWIGAEFGSMENYATKILGAGHDLVEALRNALLEP